MCSEAKNTSNVDQFPGNTCVFITPSNGLPFFSKWKYIVNYQHLCKLGRTRCRYLNSLAFGILINLDGQSLARGGLISFASSKLLWAREKKRRRKVCEEEVKEKSNGRTVEISRRVWKVRMRKRERRRESNSPIPG